MSSPRAPLVTSKTNIKRILVRLAEQGTLKFWEKKKKLAKMVRMNILKLWKLTKGLQKPKEHFFKKNS